MRICFFASGNSLQGGAEISQTRIVRYLLEQKSEVHVVLPAKGELSAYYEELGAVIHVMAWQHLRTLKNPLHVLRYAIGLPSITFRLAKLLRETQADLLHVNEILDYQGIYAARLAHVPCLIYCRWILEPKILRRILAWLVLHSADRIVCVSRAVHRMVFGETENPKVTVIYNAGPDPRRFDFDSLPPLPSEKNPETVVFGMVSKLVRLKGHLVFLELLAQLKSAASVNIKGLIVGGSVKGHEKYKEHLLQRIKESGLEDDIESVGEQRSVAEFIEKMDVFCHVPLVEDPFPAVPMEGAILGRPVLGFASGGMLEQLTHPENARLVTIGAVGELVKHGLELAEDPSLRRAMGKRAYSEIRSKFSEEKHFAELTSVYQQLIQRCAVLR